MVDPVVIPLINVGVALTSMLLNAAQQSEAAAIASEARDPISFLAQSLLGRRGTQKDIERRISKDLTSRMQDMNERCSREGIDPDRLANPCAEVEDILRAIDDHKRFLEQAVHDPDAVRAFFEQQAQNSRIQVDERLVPYFDELLKAVTELYITYAERSSNYQQLALKQLLKSDREKRETLAHVRDTMGDVSHRLADLVSSDSKPSRVFFGSRPDAVAGERFVERDEHEQLKAVITDPTRHRTVLWGMRGCGKTQLAASLAKRCEDANWSIVAWINAVSRESIQSDLVELAKQLGIGTSDQPTQDQVIRRLLNHVKSAKPADRLIIFDNVEDINDLRGLMPSGDGLRVVVTTTNNTGWEDDKWTIIKVGVFDRCESIDYLLKVTKSDDHDTADALAERLGDLPLAIAQAAAFARKRKLDLAQYLDRLDAYRSEHRSGDVMPAVPGDYYARDVATALRVAIDDTLKELEASMSRAARHHLGVLALLAESGVPTRWLDPLTEEHHYQDPRDRDRAADDDAHDALTELLDRSIIQQSADGSMTMLHRLQAQAYRKSWSKEEREQACESAAALLDSVDIDRFRADDSDARLQETRNLIEHLRAFGAQDCFHYLRDYRPVTSALCRAFTHARDLGLLPEALSLEQSVDTLLDLQVVDALDILRLRSHLAYAYLHDGRSANAIRLYEEVLSSSKHALGPIDRVTLTIQNDLAYAYYWVDRTGEAINLFEQVLDERTRILRSDHEDMLMTGSYLALAYADDGQLERAITLGEQVVKDRDRVLKPDHKHTLVTRNNLADAYKSVGRLTDAIEMYEYVLQARIRTLGNTHHHTRITRNDLAQTYEQAGDLPKAISMYEDLHNDHIRIYGPDHESTIEVRDRLEAAKRELERQEDDSAAE